MIANFMQLIIQMQYYLPTTQIRQVIQSFSSNLAMAFQLDQEFCLLVNVQITKSN